MTKFIVTYYAPTTFMEQMQDTNPEEAAKGMATWMAWAEKCGESLIDMGSPLGGGRRVNTSGNSPSEKNIVGYSVLETSDMATAEKLLEGHPHLQWEDACEIEVHECLPMHE